MRMKAAVIAGAITAMGIGTAGAAPGVPVPGQANCHGQDIAFYAHYGRDVDNNLRERGLGQLAQANNVTVQDIQQFAAADCQLP
jgi:hypothetical protein